MYACVTVGAPEDQKAIFDRLKRQPGYENWQPPHKNPNHLELRVTLTAEDSIGRHIKADTAFLITGSRIRLASNFGEPMSYTAGRNLKERIDIILGRNPQRHPPQLAWNHLSTALKRVGVVATEEELIACPLEIVLDDKARFALNL